jgi:hypothetical protein
MDLEHCGLSESISDLEVAELEPIPGVPVVFLAVKNVVRLKTSVHNINKVWYKYTVWYCTLCSTVRG